MSLWGEEGAVKVPFFCCFHPLFGQILVWKRMVHVCLFFVCLLFIFVLFAEVSRVGDVYTYVCIWLYGLFRATVGLFSSVCTHNLAS